MSPENFLETLLAINLHYKRTGSYDYIKYNGKVRLDPNKFKTRKDRFALNTFHRNESHENFIERVVSYNFYEKKNPWSAIELKKPVAKQHFLQWKNDIKNIEEIVKKDLETIDNIKEYIKIDKNKFLPDILTNVIGEKIHPFTFICIDNVIGLTNGFYEKHFKDNLIYQDSVFLYKKTKPFVVMNENIKEMILLKIKKDNE